MNNTRILAENVSVSNDTKATGLNNNDMIIGSSGSGKTGGYVIPNLQNISGSMVVSDTKGRLCKMFKNELKKKGYAVYTLDLVDPLRSCGFNPIGGIRRYANGRYREQDVLTLANTVMPVLDAREPFWEKAAAGYLAFLIAYAMEVLDPEEQNMTSVCKLHHAFIRPGGSLSFLQWAERNPDTFAARKYREINSSSNAEKMWSSIMEFANRALEPYEFEEARHIFENPDSFDIRSLGRKKTVLFLNVSDTDRTFDHLINVFYTQALQLLCSEADAATDGRLKVPVRIIMDDFAASARIPDFDKVISVIRSREISVSLILQSMTQLESMYSHAEATTIVNNCDHLIYLGSQDMETAQFIGCRAYKTPESVLCMPRDKAILMTNGGKAVLVDKIKPYSTMQNPKNKRELSM
ncbi:MAG: VirD4-like conjugal transfer protein, CD1115 family [Oscillospiraceae bacterium]